MKRYLLIICTLAYFAPLKAQGPVAEFSANSISGCAPLGVVFKDLSTGDPKFWNWDFGNGNLSTLQNPSTTYNQPGTYTVALVVRNADGTNGITKTNYITVLPSPKAAFTADRIVGCLPAAIQFQDMSTSNAGAITSWKWNFGDGGSSTDQNPSYTYTTNGFYTVSLTIRGASGCPSTTSIGRYIRVVSGINAGFDFTTDPICHIPSNVSFNNQSDGPGVLSYLWKFDDGTTDGTDNPVHGYNATGNYNVKLIATSDLGCVDSITKPLTVNSANVQFTNTTVPCNNTPITFQDISSPASSSSVWNFGDGTQSIQADPSKTYAAAGSYNVTLTNTYPFCKGSFTKTIVVGGASVDFTVDKATDCQAPLSVTFTSNAPAAVSWEWDFGDGSAISTVSNPSHIYSTAGNYTVKLTITNSSGCKSTIAKNNFIRIVAPDISLVSTAEACVNFIYKPIANNYIKINTVDPVATAIWDWGDLSGTSSGLNSTHPYTSASIFDVTLTITTMGGCSITKTFPAAVKTSSPVTGLADFSFSPVACTDLLTFKFNSTSDSSSLSGPPIYAWQFGSSASPSGASIAAPITTFPIAGTYPVTLTISDVNGCYSTATKNIITSDFVKANLPKAAFTVSDSISICQLFETKFTSQGTDYASLNWDFGDGATSETQGPTHFYNDYGTYTAKLYVRSAEGCIDSAMHSIQVIQPVSSMINYAGPYSNCNELNVDFSITTPPGTSFIFSYGDGSSDNTQNTSLQHLYSSPSTYTPVLQLTDKTGCQVSVAGANSLKVIGAEPFFSQDRKEFCDDGNVFFTNYIIKNDPVTSYIWDFGDGTTSSIDANPIHNYTPGSYITSLTVNTQSGCSKTLTDTVRVYRTPQPTITSSNIVCINDVIVFNGALAIADTSITWQWDLGNGQAPTTQNTPASYANTGDYSINLRATNLLGCSGSTSKQITVPPSPEINIAENPVIYVGSGTILPVTYINNINTYTWTPSTGLSCADCATPFAEPKSTTTYQIAVVDENGCKASKDITVTVVCNENNYFIPNTFSPNGDGNNDVFYPRGKGLYRIQSMRIFNRWGEQIFEQRNLVSNDPSGGWDGKYKGRPANADAYIYIIEVICENGQIIPIKGNVTLIR